MKLVSQKVGALSPTMAIVNGKERAPRPEVDLLELGLDDIENDRDSVFVIVPHHSLVRIGRICDYNAIFLGCKLRWVIVLSEFHDLLLFHFHVFFALTDGHLHASVLNDIIRAKIFLTFLALSFILCLLCLTGEYFRL